MICDMAVLKLLTGANTLLDAQLTGINVRQSGRGVDVDLSFKSRAGSDFPFFCLKFTEVQYFDFSYEEPQVFLEIWEFKFIKLADGCFYLTLDPDPSTLGSAGVEDLQDSETDRFCVRARHVEFVITNS